MEVNKERYIQVVFIGPKKSGKSNLVYRLRDDSFIENHIPTIGCSFCEIDCTNYDFMIKIWEISGNKIYSKKLPPYIENTEIIAIVFDPSTDNYKKELESFLKCSKKKFKIKNATAPYLEETQIILIANKMDKINNDNIKIPETMKKYPLFKISTKDNLGISFLKRYLLFFKGSSLMDIVKKNNVKKVKSCMSCFI